LDYATARSGRRSALLQRAVLVLFIGLAIASATPLALSSLRHTRMRRYFDQCAQMSPAAVTYREVISPATRPAPVPYMPAPWSNLNIDLGSTPISLGTLFLHEMHVPNGSSFLIGMDLVNWRATDSQSVLMQTHARAVLPPGRGAPRYGPATDPSLLLPRWRQNLILHGGRMDPKDPTHFTIEYELDDTQGIIDGWLKGEGAIELELRQPPATTSPAPLSPGKSR
jgi:hypothetical protein